METESDPPDQASSDQPNDNGHPTGSQSNTVEASSERRLAGSWLLALIACVLVVILLGAVLVGMFGIGNLNATTQVFSVVMALVLVLGALAALSSYLGIASATDAFGLPRGTIRAVLAIGLLIAFVVFGIGELDRLSKGQFEPDVIVVTNDALSSSGPPTPPQILTRRQQIERAGIIVTNIVNAENSVRFEILRQPHPDYGVFSRELLATLGTLLTSILSFYFGTRSSERSRPSETETPGKQGVSGTNTALPSVRGRSISFDAPNFIRHAERGLAVFRPGDKLKVTSAQSPNNDRIFTVDSVSQGEIKTVENVTQAPSPGPNGTEIVLTKQV